MYTPQYCQEYNAWWMTLIAAFNYDMPTYYARFPVYIPKVLYSEDSIFRRFYVSKVLCSEGSMFRIPVGPMIHSVKLNSLVPKSFHLAIYYNEVWGRGTNITLFSASSHSKVFLVTSRRFPELPPGDELIMIIIYRRTSGEICSCIFLMITDLTIII